MVFTVITHVPNAREGHPGNLCTATELYERAEHATAENGFMGTVKPVDLIDCINFSIPVFAVGEIVITDTPGGREVCGLGRKPNKWDVDYEVFDSLEHAIKKSNEITYGQETT